jgi:hypothetical protein
MEHQSLCCKVCDSLQPCTYLAHAFIYSKLNDQQDVLSEPSRYRVESDHELGQVRRSIREPSKLLALTGLHSVEQTNVPDPIFALLLFNKQQIWKDKA